MGRNGFFGSRSKLLGLAAAVLAWGGLALAAGPSWMAGFPMRMGAAGTMLMWMPVPGATEYKVFRKLGAGNWEQVAKIPMNTFQDPTAPQDQDISYKVVPVSGGKDGDESPVAALAGLKPQEAPSGITHRLQDNQLNLRWEVPPGASFYNLYRGTSKEGPFDLLGSVQDSKYVDAKIEDGKTYYYVITAVSTGAQESKKPAPYEVKIDFPKVVVEKQFKPVRRNMKLLKKSRGEDFAEFSNPIGLVLLGGKVYVSDETGVQVLDADGNYLERLPLIQEMVAKREWQRPMLISATPQGTLFVNFILSPVVREFDAAGTKVLREITLPDPPANGYKTSAAALDVGPGDKLWAADDGHGQVVVLPGDATTPTEAQVTRIGWALGSQTPWDNKEFRFKGATGIRYLPQMKAVGVLQPSVGSVQLVDPATLKPLEVIGGPGAALNKMKSIGDFVEYDETSIVVADVLGKELKRLKRDGDYVESFVDDKEKLNLQAPQSFVRAAWDPKLKRFYLLGSIEGALFVYQVE